MGKTKTIDWKKRLAESKRRVPEKVGVAYYKGRESARLGRAKREAKLRYGPKKRQAPGRIIGNIARVSRGLF